MKVRGHASRRGHSAVLALVFFLLASSAGTAAERIRIGGTGTGLGTMRLLANEFTAKNPDTDIMILPSLGSSGGIRAVAAGAIDIAVTARPMNESERGPGLTEIEYARTPLVFAVSAHSTVSAISSGQLADLYAGNLKTWADGSPARIVLRQATDSDTEIVRNISPEIRRGLVAAQARPGVRMAATDQDAADDLERIPGAIGPIALAVIVSENRPLRVLTLDGKKPTPLNAASGAYPHFKRLFLVTSAKRSAVVDRFLAFVRSSAGQKILVRNGQWVP